jgi:single-strand DNA-binding protein
MNGINLTIAGNLTREPEAVAVNNGTSLTKFSLACERSWRTPAGEWDKAVTYVDVVCWKNLADDTAKLLEKGVRVIVTGRLDQQTWQDKETGQNRSRLEVTADEVAISLRAVESFERRRYDENAGNGAARGGQRPAQPQRRPAPAQGNDDIWDD